MVEKSGVIFNAFNIILVRLDYHLLIWDAGIVITQVNIEFEGLPTHEEISITTNTFDPQGIVSFELHGEVTENIIGANFPRVSKGNRPLAQ